MMQHYLIANHCIGVSGETLCTAIEQIPGFKTFLTQEPAQYFIQETTEEVTGILNEQYTFAYEDVKGSFGKTETGNYMQLTPENGESLWVNCVQGSNQAMIKGNFSPYLLRFGLWIAYGLLTLKNSTVAIHSSCIIYKDKAVLFLGESGTGKSTHTRLWREHIAGAVLLNDDSPIIRIENGKAYAYGSPWSGKTPCYKQERYELKGCVRLSQAPYNAIKKLIVLQGYGAIHPSCPPEFAYDDTLYDLVSEVISGILSAVPCYHLACLPDKDAALLSCQTLFDQ